MVNLLNVVSGLGKALPGAVANRQQIELGREEMIGRRADALATLEQTRRTAEQNAIKDAKLDLEKRVTDFAAEASTFIIKSLEAGAGDPATLLAVSNNNADAIGEYVAARNEEFGRKVFSEAEWRKLYVSKVQTAVNAVRSPEQRGQAAGAEDVAKVGARAQAFGVSPQAAAQAAGMIPAPTKVNLQFLEVEAAGQKFIVGLNPETGQEATRIFAGETPKGAFETRVDELVERGFPLAMAQDIAANRLQLAIHPVSQEPVVVNLATQQMVPVPGSVVEFAQAGAAQGAPGGTAFDAINGVGAIPFFAQGLSRTIGQFADAANFPEITTARTRLKGLREQIIVAFAKSGRPPVVEQERILQLIPSLGPFESVPNATAALAELRSQLIRQHVDDLSYAARTDQPAEERRKALVRAEDTRRVIEFIGEPPAGAKTSYVQPTKPLTEWTNQELMEYLLQTPGKQ